jgi:hypothetical protein
MNTHATVGNKQYQFCDLEIGKKQVNNKSCGSKRKYQDAFTESTYDDIRYGQHIGEDFFKNNYGNSYCNLESLEQGEVYHPDNIKEITDKDGNKVSVDEILSWCKYYLSNRNLFKI